MNRTLGWMILYAILVNRQDLRSWLYLACIMIAINFVVDVCAGLAWFAERIK